MSYWQIDLGESSTKDFFKKRGIVLMQDSNAEILW
jgi:hypothetical protein